MTAPAAAPLAATAAADDVHALRAEARAWCADRTKPLRSALVADLDDALGRALAERDHRRRELDALRDDLDRLLAAECPPAAPCPLLRATLAERDRLARRIRGARAVLDGAAVAAAPPEPDPDDAFGPCGWTAR